MLTISKPAWFYKTINRLSKYQEHQRRGTYLHEEISRLQPKTTTVYSLAPAHSGTSDQVGDISTIIIDKENELREIEIEIILIDKAISMLDAPKQLIVSEKYINGFKDYYTWILLKRKFPEIKARSKDIYYRLKDEAVEELARTFGYLKEGEVKECKE